MRSCFLLMSFVFSNAVFSQKNADILMSSKHSNDTLLQKAEKISLLIYQRAISDAKNNWRIDQNIVANFKPIKWFAVEIGLRYGERPNAVNSYFHYKVELQSFWFRNIVRVLARMSDNVIFQPKPDYRKTNELVVAEFKYLLPKSFQIFAGAGYVFSAKQNNSDDVLPTNKGTKNNYPIFKLALRYTYNKKGDVELMYGSYDVFNPYMYNQPFVQASTTYEVTDFCTLQSYFRYQYNHSFIVPNNYFIAVGAKFRLI